ncbi:hypothetical protein H5410_020216 [Solanum commersonii]|uniref:60S ribosomal protein L35 n=1 Tax=Solanum commersonii TaxID=4109 RepID=A0A9J5ZAK0_SOLCO|nr:hypothetical protein H5410_020216 [Solanum commersonii]
MARIKVHELRNKSKTELLAQLKDLKAELALLRVAKVTGGAPNKLSKIMILLLYSPYKLFCLSEVTFLPPRASGKMNFFEGIFFLLVEATCTKRRVKYDTHHLDCHGGSSYRNTIEEFTGRYIVPRGGLSSVPIILTAMVAVAI